MKQSTLNFQGRQAFRMLCVWSLLITTTISRANEPNELKRYDVKSAIVHYKLTTTGNTIGSTVEGSGNESLYFKDWGAIELLEEEATQTTHTKIFGNESTETNSTHTLNKINHSQNYNVDFDRKTITLSKNAAIDAMQQNNTDVSEAGRKMLKNMGGEIIGHDIILGRDCEIWKVIGSKQWMHKGVVLRIETSILGIKTTKEATSAEFNIPVADKYFKLPDFPIQEAEDYQDNDTYDEEMKAMDENMEQLRKMTFTEWKNKYVTYDTNLQAMSDQELHQTYDMIQKMIRIRMEQ